MKILRKMLLTLKSGIMWKLCLLSGFLLLFIPFITASGQSENIIASPHYLLPEFTKGTVMLKSGVPRELKMNYNSITEEMIFEYPGKYLALTNLETIDTVYILNRKFVPLEEKFYEILVNRQIPLLAQYTCSLVAPGKPTGYGGTSETTAVTSVSQLYSKGRAYEMKLPDDYKVIPSTSFFLVKNGALNRISNIRQVIKIFPDKEAEIKEFAKKHKSDFEKPTDMVDLITFCNK
jgi:hypothetical protein